MFKFLGLSKCIGLHSSILYLLGEYNRPLELEFLVKEINSSHEDVATAINDLNEAGVYIHLIKGIVYYTKDKREYHKDSFRVTTRKD
jgi:hypothetical protein